MTTAPNKPKSKAKPARKRADWDAIRRDYSTARFTLRELQDKHGAHNATISRHVRDEGWKQDLSSTIKQATNAKLIQAVVAAECSKSQQKTVDTVLAAADFNVSIILSHRTRLSELAVAVDKAKDLVLTLGQSVQGVHEAAKFTQAICNLVTSTKVLIEQERKAFGLDNETERSNPQDAFAALIADISARGSRLPIRGLQ